ncbi:MAG: LysR family transcriptional regulator [Lachnospiraceae bacterium]|nr:LysR family transcriptional regulator [Lachnospiraceae bacterium]
MLNSCAVKYLEDFIVLSETGNYQKACDILYMSKTTLSNHIRSLETELGQKLFTQSGHQVVLTKFGSFFLEYAGQFAELDLRYETAKAAWVKELATEVRIAVSIHMSFRQMVNQLWEQFSRKYPQYHLSTFEYQADLLSSEDLFSMGYELDLGVSSSPEKPGVESLVCARSRLFAVLPLTHPLAGKSVIRLCELSGEQFIFPPRETALHQISLAFCREAGFDPDIIFTMRGSSNRIELAACHAGVTLSTAHSAAENEYKDQVAFVPLEPAATIYLNLYCKNEETLSAPARAFLRYTKQMQESTPPAEGTFYNGPEAAENENDLFE